MSVTAIRLPWKPSMSVTAIRLPWKPSVSVTAIIVFFYFILSIFVRHLAVLKTGRLSMAQACIEDWQSGLWLRPALKTGNRVHG